MSIEQSTQEAEAEAPAKQKADEVHAKKGAELGREREEVEAAAAVEKAAAENIVALRQRVKELEGAEQRAKRAEIDALNATIMRRDAEGRAAAAEAEVAALRSASGGKSLEEAARASKSARLFG